MTAEQPVDQRYYQVATPGSLAERLTAYARDGIYRDFLRLTRPSPDSTILDVGVSDVTGEAANVLERKYPHLERVTAVGLGGPRIPGNLPTGRLSPDRGRRAAALRGPRVRYRHQQCCP